MKEKLKRDIEIIPSVYKSPGQDGDFGWMIEQDEYKDAFFIFNDNEDQFFAYQNSSDDKKSIGCQPGGGNAIIRPWQCKTPPRAGGIPTGTTAGYKNLDQKTKVKNITVRDLIDKAIDNIKITVEENHYKRVYFSSESTDGKIIGTGIFKVGDDVKLYIVKRIYSIIN